MKKLIALLLVCVLTGCSKMSEIVLDKAEINQQPIQTEETYETEEPQQTTQPQQTEEITYIANKNTKKFHYPSCSSVSDMKEKNKRPLKCTRDEAISQGYDPCGRCNP